MLEVVVRGRDLMVDEVVGGVEVGAAVGTDVGGVVMGAVGSVVGGSVFIIELDVVDEVVGGRVLIVELVVVVPPRVVVRTVPGSMTVTRSWVEVESTGIVKENPGNVKTVDRPGSPMPCGRQ